MYKKTSIFELKLMLEIFESSCVCFVFLWGLMLRITQKRITFYYKGVNVLSNYYIDGPNSKLQRGFETEC